MFDALTHERPYKQAWPVDEAVAEILSQAGQQFDPRVVDAFSMLDHPTLLSRLKRSGPPTKRRNPSWENGRSDPG